MNAACYAWLKARVDRMSMNWVYNAEVLEIGSLTLEGPTARDIFTGRAPFGKTRHGGYCGIDLVAGRNVDVVFDASLPLWKWTWSEEQKNMSDSPEKAFEVVVMTDVLQFAKSAETLCKNAFACLVKGGTLLLAVDNTRESETESKRFITPELLAGWLAPFAYVEIDAATIPGSIASMAVRA